MLSVEIVHLLSGALGTQAKPTIYILLAAPHIICTSSGERHADNTDANGNHNHGGNQWHHKV